jgi:hypothetical protein
VSGGYRVRSDLVDIDRQHFEDLVERAREHLMTRTPERAVALLTEALALWRGLAFGELEEWMPGRLEAVRLGQLRLAAEEDLLQARLDAGDHLGVAADGTVLTGQQPFRERRWALLALAQYRSGRQADALASIRAARRALGQELGLDPGSELVTLESRILAQDPGLAADHEARMADQACPWKGLEPYGDGDGETFFGRDADIAACLARLAESPLLVVTGPSGSGKSSLVRAGLVPVLRRSRGPVEVFTPGTDGALAMAAARQRWPGDPVLVVDQFEEAFTLRDAAYARPWLGDLARYARESAPVVIVVRGDHVAALGGDPELARLTERGLHLVAPLSSGSVREVVEKPAKAAGLRCEPGLVDLLVRDAEGQPGALPLLSHALTETWRRREAGLLTVDAYLAAGGIRDAVAASAERLYAGLTEEEQNELRWLMLHLVSQSETGEPFRTPLAAGLAAGLDDVRQRLLDLLVRARLVTSHAGGFDLAHEALVRAWPRLRAWLDEDQAGQQIRQHLAMTAAGWEALGRPEAELYRGARLTAALDWLERGHEPLSDVERDFVDASRAESEEELRQLETEAAWQRSRNRRLRALVAAAAALALVATVSGVVAVKRGRDAEAQHRAADLAAKQEAHRALVASSLRLRTSKPDIAAMLAVVAWEQQHDDLATSALLGSLTAQPELIGYRYVWPGFNPAVAAVPGRTDMLVASGNALQVLNPEAATLSPAFGRYGAATDLPSQLRVSADGTRAVQRLEEDFVPGCRGVCRSLKVYDLVAKSSIGRPIPVPFDAGDVAISDDGSVVAAVGIGGSTWDTGTWDATSGRPLARARLGGEAVTFGPDGRLLVASHDGRVRELAPDTLETSRSWQASPVGRGAALVRAGNLLLSSGEARLTMIDLSQDRRTWSVPTHCVRLAVSQSLGRVYCGLEAGSIVERDLASGRPTGREFDAHLPLGDLVVTSGAGGAQELFLQGDNQGYYARWRLDGPGQGGRLLAPGAVASGGFDPSGRLVLTTRHGRSKIMNLDGDTVLAVPRRGKAVWLSSSVVGVLGRRPVLVDVTDGHIQRLRTQGVVGLFRGTDSRGWAVSQAGGFVTVGAFSLVTGEPTEPRRIEIANSRDVRVAKATMVAAQGGRLLVTLGTAGTPELPGYIFTTEEFDAESGKFVGAGTRNLSRLALLPDGAFLGAGNDGSIGRYTELSNHPDRELGRIAPGISSLQVSDDGQRAVATVDSQVFVFDPDGRDPFDDPVPARPPRGEVAGWLDPDGSPIVLTNNAEGVVLWDLTPQVMAQRLCSLAGRNPTYVEWGTYVGKAAYRAPCPGYPSAVDQYLPE